MAREPRELLFVGIKNVVVALDPLSGSEVWRTKLKGGDFVTVLWDGRNLFAVNNGEVFLLESAGGGFVWKNVMKGLRTGVVTLANLVAEKPSPTPYEIIAELMRRNAAAASSESSG